MILANGSKEYLALSATVTRRRGLPRIKNPMDWSSVERNPARYAQTATIDELTAALSYMDKSYYNHSPVVSDGSYDILRETLKQRDPDHPYLNRVGSQVPSRDRRRANLPVFMPSLNKLYPNTTEYDRWFKTPSPKGYMVMDKLNGTSLLLVYSHQGVKGYTRGDGSVGQDVSEILPALRNIPKAIKGLAKDQVIVVRGELIISRADFESKYKAKTTNADGHSAARFTHSTAMINGAVNSLYSKGARSSKDAGVLIDAKFLAHELIRDKEKGTEQMSPQVQFTQLKHYGFHVVPYRVYTAEQTTQAFLESLLNHRKLKAEYDVDGLVVSRNMPYLRTNEGRPKYAFAFKDNKTSEQKVAEVVGVVWSVTRTGVLAPRVEIQPTHLSGSNIRYLTGFNAYFIEHGWAYTARKQYEGKKPKPLGPRAKIRIVKSGDVIPYIMDVVVPAAAPDMPKVPYQYDSNKVNVYLKPDLKPDLKQGSKSSPQTKSTHHPTALPVFQHFFQTIGAKNIGPSVIGKYLEISTKVLPFLKMSKKDMETQLGLSPTMAAKLHTSIANALAEADLPKLAAATGLFGRGVGETRLKAVFASVPNMLSAPLETEKNRQRLAEKIAVIDGLSHTTALQIVDALPKFRGFIAGLGVKAQPAKKVAPVSDRLSKVTVVFSTVRDSDLEKAITQHGGTVAPSVTAKTTHVVVKDLSKVTTKIAKARDLGVSVITVEAFKRKFGF